MYTEIKKRIHTTKMNKDARESTPSQKPEKEKWRFGDGQRGGSPGRPSVHSVDGDRQRKRRHPREALGGSSLLPEGEKQHSEATGDASRGAVRLQSRGALQSPGRDVMTTTTTSTVSPCSWRGRAPQSMHPAHSNLLRHVNLFSPASIWWHPVERMSHLMTA